MKGEQGWFAKQVLQWQAEHGRHDLPWQGSRDPYRVWLSEIMLQQTQVETVRRYFARFVHRFPDLPSLAAAHADDVLALWSGLGYYSRARNLHRCAIVIQETFGGEFPRSSGVLETLPGIGRSTAAAIASICFGERAAILDGNVRRVLARYLGFDADLSSSALVDELWQRAHDLLPVENLQEDMPRYTQALMDLGATVCRRSKPACERCPLGSDCVARRDGRQSELPVKSRKLRRRSEQWWLLWVERPDGAIWLERRPDKGIWAGLYCLPVMRSQEELEALVSTQDILDTRVLSPLIHPLTHVDLHLHPVRIRLQPGKSAFSGGSGEWHVAQSWRDRGLPAPVRNLLAEAVDKASA